MTKAVIHSETQEFPNKTLIVFATFASIAFIPFVLSLPWWMVAGIMIVAVLLAALVYSVMILRIEVTQTTLEFGYWFSAPKISLTDIRDLEVIDIPKLAGIGRHNYKRYHVYNARFGRGIQFTTAKRKYMVGSDQPDQLLSILNTAMPRNRQS